MPSTSGDDMRVKSTQELQTEPLLLEITSMLVLAQMLSDSLNFITPLAVPQKSLVAYESALLGRLLFSFFKMCQLSTL